MKRNIAEISDDPALRFYGVGLGVSYLVTYVFFYIYRIHLFLTSSSEVVCWPFFPSCDSFHGWNGTQSLTIIHIFGLLSLMFTLAFVLRKIRLGYFLLSSTSFYTLVLILQDFRFRQNQHYMLLWATFAYLWIPKKREILTFLIISFYWWAGRLKLNEEWLSGSVIYSKMWLIPQQYLPMACAYVVVLEMVLIWGLVSRRAKIFWPVFLQLLLFHLLSWSQVGFYYPILMFGIISIFPLCFFFRRAETSMVDFLRGRLKKSTYGMMLFFGFLQLIPLFYAGDPTLVGEGRIYALHMFEARQKCNVVAIEKYRNRIPRVLDLTRHDLPPRTMCEPIIYFNRALQLCKEMRRDPAFADFDFYMDIAKATMPRMKPLMAIQDFCAQDLKYNLILRNPWLLPVSSD